MQKVKQPSVYAYTDYRSFLRDYYNARSSNDRVYSHRNMAKELGFPSPNYIKLVMDGKRNIGLRSIDRLMRGLGLNDKEQEYLSYMIFFCQAKTPVEKNYFYGLMASLRTPFTTATITEAAYRYYSEWYHCVVRELVVREKPPVDYQAVARKIIPHVTATQVRKSVELLCELGMIRLNEDGSYTLLSRIQGTDREVVAVGIRKYHKRMMDFAKESIDLVNRDRREVSSLTLSISETCMRQIKERIQHFEDEILQMVRDDINVNQVYQLNFQFFPLAQEAE